MPEKRSGTAWPEPSESRGFWKPGSSKAGQSSDRDWSSWNTDGQQNDNQNGYQRGDQSGYWNGYWKNNNEDIHCNDSYDSQRKDDKSSCQRDDQAEDVNDKNDNLDQRH